MLQVRKTLKLNNAELTLDDAETGKFSGYASVFGGIDSYGDTIAPGAYKDTLQGRERPIRMRWNHYGPVIGKWLSMVEDTKGLLVAGELTPGHRVAIDTYASLKHGAVDGMSIGYTADQFHSNADGIRVGLSQLHRPGRRAGNVLDLCVGFG